MKIELGPHDRVHCRAEIVLPMAAISVWGQLRDFHRYASHDYFHADLRVEGGRPRQGAQLRLEHRVGPFFVRRHGRIVWWREGHGYAFSDLSRRGPRHGFPHVLILHLVPAPTVTGQDESCVLHVAVRGRWTATWLPYWVRRLWLAWVFSYIVVKTHNALLAVHITRRRATRPVAQDGTMT